MGNAESGSESDSEYSDGDVEAGSSKRNLKRGGAGGEEEKKGSGAGEAESKSRPGTAATQKPARAVYQRPAALASDSESDSDDELDEEERQRRARLDIRQYEYDPEQVEELIMMSGSTCAAASHRFHRVTPDRPGRCYVWVGMRCRVAVCGTLMGCVARLARRRACSDGAGDQQALQAVLRGHQVQQEPGPDEAKGVSELARWASLRPLPSLPGGRW